MNALPTSTTLVFNFVYTYTEYLQPNFVMYVRFSVEKVFLVGSGRKKN